MSRKTGELMTVPELQEHLTVGRTTAYRLVRTGQIKSYRVGRLLRVRRQDALRWLEANENRRYPAANAHDAKQGRPGC
jgi:excisionase family DNA binding protein